jgi:hypothetical protein
VFAILIGPREGHMRGDMPTASRLLVYKDLVINCSAFWNKCFTLLPFEFKISRTEVGFTNCCSEVDENNVHRILVC